MELFSLLFNEDFINHSSDYQSLVEMAVVSEDLIFSSLLHQEWAVMKKSVKVKKKKKRERERKHTPLLHITIMRKTHLVGHDLMSSDYTHD